MLDRLVDLIVQFIGLFQVCFVLDVYEVGVILRFGRLRKIAKEPGLYWIWPFGIERHITDTAVPTARDLAAQMVTLADGTTIAVGPVLTYRTNDPVKLLLECDEAETALRDAARGTIREVLSRMSWEEIVGPESNVTEALTKAVRKVAWKWGIEVLQVSLADASRVKVLRVITGG